MTCIKNEDDTYNINLFVTENDPLLATIDGGGVTMPIMWVLLERLYIADDYGRVIMTRLIMFECDGAAEFLLVFWWRGWVC